MDYQNRCRIWFPGVVVSKLRPRFRFLDNQEKSRRAAKKGISIDKQSDTVVYLADRYRKWKEDSIQKIESAIGSLNIDKLGQDWDMPSSLGVPFFPSKPLDVQIDFFGKHRGDRDNQFAAIIDVLVSAKIMGEIKNGKERYSDAPSFMPSGEYKTWKSARTGALITLSQVPKTNPFFEEEDLVKVFKKTESQGMLIWIPGKCFSKLRPRGSNGWVGNNREYSAWKTKNSSLIRYKLRFPHINEFSIDRLMVSGSIMKSPLKVTAHFIGKGHGGDCDNRLGAILDVIVDSGICANDGVNFIPSGSFKCFQSKTLTGTLIKIETYSQILDWTCSETSFPI